MSTQPLLVRDFMTANPTTVRPHDSIETVLKLLEEKHVSGLPVVDESEKMIGIISEGDLLFKESPIRMPLYLTFLGSVIYLEPLDKFDQQLKKSLGMNVQDAMTQNPITVTPETQIAQAAGLMIQKRINRLPVVDEASRLVGIITRSDLVRALKSD